MTEIEKAIKEATNSMYEVLRNFYRRMNELQAKELSKSINEAIEELDDINDGWIPVEDKNCLPEENKSYLVTTQTLSGRRYIKKLQCAYAGTSPRVTYWDGRQGRGEVIAWQSLPEPYCPEGSCK